MKTLKGLIATISVVFILAACGTQPTVPVANNPTTGTSTLVLAGHSKPTTVTYDIVNGLAIFEGDIILGKVDAKGHLLEKSELNTQGIGISGNDYRWPLGVVPYTISSTVTSMGRQQIQAAMAEWQTKTNIRFVPKRAAHKDYVLFTRGNEANACSSEVGRVGGEQEILLTSNGDCSKGALIHEIGHAIGLWHEQSREDRDTYVKILEDNIESGKGHNFDQHVSDGFDIGSYDFRSIMHYGCTDFGIKINGIKQRTLTPINPPVGVSCTATGMNRVGQRIGLSTGDIAASERLYRNFQNLGGTLTSAPAVASWGEGRLDVFVRATDNSLYHKAWNGSSWSSWVPLGGFLTSDPAAVSWGPNRIDVFAKGGNNQLIHKRWNGSSWSNWEDLGGTLTEAPAVVSRGVGRLDVFVRATDNSLYQKSWNGTTWGNWQALGGTLTSAPAAVAQGSGRIDIFVRATDNSLYQRIWKSGVGWSGWQGLGGTLTSAPTVAHLGSGRLEVFVRATDNSLYRKFWSGSAWSDWEGLGGQMASAPSAISWGENRLDIFFRGMNDALYQKYWDGN